MTSALAALREIAVGRAWPLAFVTAAGWLCAYALDRSTILPRLCGNVAAAPGSGTASTIMTALAINASGLRSLGWLAMLVAMMTPLIWQPLLHVWDRSLADRRGRALLLFSIAYLGPWLVAMAVLTVPAIALLATTNGAAVAFPFCLGVALLWQGTSLKARALRRCHRLGPLPAFGFAADLATLRFGALVAASCIASCWALMLLPLTAGAFHGPVMAATAAQMLTERYARPRRAIRSWPLLVGGSVLVVSTVAASTL